MIHFEKTQYGFEWGAAVVTRLCSSVEKGWVTLRIETPKHDMQVYVTKTGQLRVFANGEWKPVEGKPKHGR